MEFDETTPADTFADDKPTSFWRSIPVSYSSHTAGSNTYAICNPLVPIGNEKVIVVVVVVVFQACATVPWARLKVGM